MFVSNASPYSQLLWTPTQATDNQQKEKAIALCKAVESKNVEEAIQLIETGMDIGLLLEIRDRLKNPK